MSDKCGGGKSYPIQQDAKNMGKQIVKIPINTRDIRPFLFQRLYEAHKSYDIVFHLDISSCASDDINLYAFEMLILQHFSLISGERLVFTEIWNFFLKPMKIFIKIGIQIPQRS